jgi:hypothetical protein
MSNITTIRNVHGAPVIRGITPAPVITINGIGPSLLPQSSQSVSVVGTQRPVVTIGTPQFNIKPVINISVPRPVINVPAPQPVVNVVTPQSTVTVVDASPIKIDIPAKIVDLLILHQLRHVISYNRFMYRWNQLKTSLWSVYPTVEAYKRYGVPQRYIAMLELDKSSIEDWLNTNLEHPQSKDDLKDNGYSNIDEFYKDVEYFRTKSEQNATDTTLRNAHPTNVIDELMESILELHLSRRRMDTSTFTQRLKALHDKVTEYGITESQLNDYDIPYRYIAQFGLYGITMTEWLLEQNNNPTELSSNLEHLGYLNLKEFLDDYDRHIDVTTTLEIRSISKAAQYTYDDFVKNHNQQEYNTAANQERQVIYKNKLSADELESYQMSMNLIVRLKLVELRLVDWFADILSQSVYESLPAKYFTKLGFPSRNEFELECQLYDVYRIHRTGHNKLVTQNIPVTVSDSDKDIIHHTAVMAVVDMIYDLMVNTSNLNKDTFGIELRKIKDIVIKSNITRQDLENESILPRYIVYLGIYGTDLRAWLETIKALDVEGTLSENDLGNFGYDSKGDFDDDYATYVTGSVNKAPVTNQFGKLNIVDSTLETQPLDDDEWTDSNVADEHWESEHQDEIDDDNRYRVEQAAIAQAPPLNTRPPDARPQILVNPVRTSVPVSPRVQPTQITSINQPAIPIQMITPGVNNIRIPTQVPPTIRLPTTMIVSEGDTPIYISQNTPIDVFPLQGKVINARHQH